MHQNDSVHFVFVIEFAAATSAVRFEVFVVRATPTVDMVIGDYLQEEHGVEQRGHGRGHGMNVNAEHRYDWPEQYQCQVDHYRHLCSIRGDSALCAVKECFGFGFIGKGNVTYFVQSVLDHVRKQCEHVQQACGHDDGPYRGVPEEDVANLGVVYQYAVLDQILQSHSQRGKYQQNDGQIEEATKVVEATRRTEQ